MSELYKSLRKNYRHGQRYSDSYGNMGIILYNEDPQVFRREFFNYIHKDLPENENERDFNLIDFYNKGKAKSFDWKFYTRAQWDEIEKAHGIVRTKPKSPLEELAEMIAKEKDRSIREIYINEAFIKMNVPKEELINLINLHEKQNK